MELQQTGTLIQSARAYLPNMALTNTVEEIESRFDDIRTAQYLVKTYVEDAAVKVDEDMKRFTQEVEKVCQAFTAAISTLDTSRADTQFNECFMAYENALDGIDEEGKFTYYWRNLLTREEVRKLALTRILFFTVEEGFKSSVPEHLGSMLIIKHFKATDSVLFS